MLFGYKGGHMRVITISIKTHICIYICIYIYIYTLLMSLSTHWRSVIVGIVEPRFEREVPKEKDY